MNKSNHTTWTSNISINIAKRNTLTCTAIFGYTIIDRDPKFKNFKNKEIIEVKVMEKCKINNFPLF